MKKIIFIIFFFVLSFVFKNPIMAGCCYDNCYATCTSSNSSVGTCRLGQYTCYGITYNHASCIPSCNNGNGWYSSCQGGVCTSATFSCTQCSNDLTCYHIILTPDCYSNSDCGCLTCYNPGTANAYCGAPNRCCIPDCSCASSTCIGSSCSDGCGGNCSGTKSPDCSCASSTCIGSSCSNGCGGSCPGTIVPVAGVDGACKTPPNGATLLNPPLAADACSSGTAQMGTPTATTFPWTCNGSVGICPSTGGGIAQCSANRNLPPQFTSITIKDSDLDIVPPEDIPNPPVGVSIKGNQICQLDFSSSSDPSTINATVTATDPNGVADITNIELRWNGHNFTRTSFANGTANFTYTFAAGDYTSGPIDYQVRITDSVDNTTGWISANRSFKPWDCQVSASGTIYDGSNTGAQCANPSSFSMLNTKPFTLSMITSGIPTSMTATSISTYASNANPLTWGKNYIFSLVISGNINAYRINGTSCSNLPSFTTDNNVANPYNSTVSFTGDFSVILNQDPWWQTENGGAFSNDQVVDRIPVTCVSNCQISLGGLIAAPIISNPTINDWNFLGKLANTSNNYQYFYNQYFIKNGIGTTLTGSKKLSELGANPEGIYLISENFTVDRDTPINSPFLMIIASDNISISNAVQRFDGVLVAKNINASGESSDQLTINGSLYANDTISFSRTFPTNVSSSRNNTEPAVKVVFDPKLIFNLPAAVAASLSGWQWGN